MKAFLIVLLLSFHAAAGWPTAAPAQTIRVGIHQNSPVVLRNDPGFPDGIFVDILDTIASAEGWEIRYVFDTWLGPHDPTIPRWTWWLIGAGGGALLAFLAMNRVLRKQVRRRSSELTESRGRLQRLIGNLPGMVYRRRNDERWTMEFVSAGSFRLCGVPPEDLLWCRKQSYASLVHPDDIDRVRKAVDVAVMHHDPYQFTYRIRLPDGTIRWVREQGCAIDSDRRLQEGFVTDITQQMAAQDEVRNREAWIRRLVENIHVGACLLDRRRRFVILNELAIEYYRLLSSATVAVGQVATGIGDCDLDDLMRSKSDDLPKEIEIKGPPRRIFEAACYPVEDADAGYVLLIRDLTRQREEQARAERSYRLASVGQLAAGIAHDFNNLLTVMIGSAQLLEMQRDIPDRLKRDLQNIYRQGTRAAQLIRQILDFSRQSGAEKKPIDPVPFIKETVRLLRRTLPESIRITTAYEISNGRILSNLTQLQQVVTNLAVNARDAMKKGGDLRIRISRTTVMPGEHPPYADLTPGKWIHLSVADTGTGMTPEVLRRIYEPFFTTKPEGEGTGLGLSQIYGIVHEHAGHIAVESALGEGSCFHLFFPEIEHAPSETGEQATLKRGTGETILLVEDDVTVRTAAAAMLEHLGYAVTTAQDGQEALSFLERYPHGCDLVLSDLVMPSVGGLELVESLRRTAKDLKIVIMTGYLTEELESRLKEQVDGWLPKPISLEEMSDTIRVVLHS